ncbi:TPA: copper-binding protein [Klebsiella pneumoniae]|nr:copper-binding protein [Klebsiella pneumoniae]MDK1753163.1 copper-binding protein [Klebsiella pneumoniae]MEC4754833.1 copper-binding protein [Klebsiella pneumoniae]WFC53722.1 copper-binding protein [Klebsiella pneumoniae]WFC59480.1 copper-binding protein [Klebsiella pneumoniae]HCB1174543.1 copper-binding protein [Klebsiella pneumoniae]
MRFTKNKKEHGLMPVHQMTICGVKNMKNTFVRFAAVAALSLAAITAQATVNTYQAHGSVVAVNAADQTITVKQDAVSELGWPARTFTYKANGSNVLNGIEAGQTVDVKFTSSNTFNANAHFVTPVSQ